MAKLVVGTHGNVFRYCNHSFRAKEKFLNIWKGEKMFPGAFLGIFYGTYHDYYWYQTGIFPPKIVKTNFLFLYTKMALNICFCDILLLGFILYLPIIDNLYFCQVVQYFDLCQRHTHRPVFSGQRTATGNWEWKFRRTMPAASHAPMFSHISCNFASFEKNEFCLHLLFVRIILVSTFSQGWIVCIWPQLHFSCLCT